MANPGKKTVAEWRSERKLTQMKLAIEADLTISTVQSVESGRRGVTVGVAQRIAKALGVSLDDIEWPSEEEIRARRPKGNAAAA